MSGYSLDDKIVNFLHEHGIDKPRIQDMTIVLPTATGELHRRVTGVINAEKLLKIVDEWKAAQANAA